MRTSVQTFTDTARAQAPRCWSLLQPWSPPGVAWQGCAIGRDPGMLAALAPPEAAAVARAVPKRQFEFAAGRWCAHRALAALGRPAAALPVGEQRAPVWPAGVVGTISHDDAWAIAGAALAGQWAGLGVDIERVDRVPLSLAPQLCTQLERAQLSALAEPARRQRFLASVFSAKEAAFKALHPATGEWIEFEDAELIALPTGPAGPFQIRLLRPIGYFARLTVLSGALALDGGQVMGLLALPARG